MAKKDLTAENPQPEPQENIGNQIEATEQQQSELKESTDEMSSTEEPVPTDSTEETSTPEPTDSEKPPTDAPAEDIKKEQVAEKADEEVVEQNAEGIAGEVNQSLEKGVGEVTDQEKVVENDVVAEVIQAKEETAEEVADQEKVVENDVVAEVIQAKEETAEGVADEVKGVEEVVDGEKVADEPLKEDEKKEVTGKEKAKPSAKSKHHADAHADKAILQEISDLDEHQADNDSDDEDDEGEAEHEEVVEQYDTYDREKLVKILEETVKEENILKIKTRVALIKVAFLRQSKENRQKLLELHLETEDGTRENYTPEPDPLVEKFNQVFETYKKNKIKFNEQQEVVKLRNLDAKKAILEELKELIASEETLKKTYDQFKDLQVKWKEIGLVPSTEINNLWQNYHFLVEKFFDKVKISKELRDLDLKKNLERKIELCEKAEELLIEPSAVRSFQQLQKYHEEWKEIGPVPQDKRDEIWERFKTTTDKINERRREHYNILSKDQDSNLIAKTTLCEKAEQLASMEIDNLKDWQEKTREVNDLLKVWKSIGPAPKKENDEIWDRFKTFLNAFFANKKEFFSKIKQEQLNNFNLKLDIVKQAEALKDSTDWRKTTQELINLQKEWKNIGPVPRKHSDKIWKRFRSACDEFFNSKTRFFSTVVESEKDNLDKKLALIQRIEEWKAGKDKSANLETLKGFQREFTEIGHVPIKEKNKVHDAFRQAINTHLDGLKINSSEMRPQGEYRSRQDSYEDSGDRYQRRGGNEWGSLSSKISKLREEILLWENNIGFLAHSKKADLLRQEFEKKIEDAKAELAQMEARLKTMQD